jgi:hypothetical protein
MATINIHIDAQETEMRSETNNLIKDVHPLAANKAGLLSSYAILPTLEQAFAYGFGSSPAKRNGKYVSGDLKQAKKDLKKLDKCNVIATIGGGVVFNAISAETDNPTFVSMFGDMPDLTPDGIGNCLGGISLESWASNEDRIGHLTSKLTCNANEIGLYYNRNSAMSGQEVANWDQISPPIAGVSSAKYFTGGLPGPPPTNDAAAFTADLVTNATFFPARVRALVISADPFFAENMDLLIDAANAWIARDPAHRYVCYPTQGYQNLNSAHKPTPSKSTVYGPDLVTVYQVLGFLAKSAIENSAVSGFFTAANLIKDL